MTPRAVVVDAYPGGFGGAHRVVEQLARVLADDGWCTSVVVPADGAAVDVLRKHGVRVDVVRAPRALLHYGATTRRWTRLAAAVALPVYWLRLIRVLRRADLVWVNDLRGLLLAGPAARAARRPLVWHVHSRPRQLRRLASVVRRLADATVVASRAAADASRLATGDVVVLPNPVDRNPVDVAAARPRDGSGRVPRVVCVARLHTDKGVDVLVRASAELKRRGVAHRVDVVGDTPDGGADYVELLRNLVTEMDVQDVVTLLGASDDVPALMADADVYVQPSRSEGMPLATLEAMAAGRAVVASRAGGLPELVDDGVTGLLVDVDTAEQLADAIEALLHDADLRARLGTAARCHVVAEHSLETFAAGVREITSAVVVRR